MLSLPPPLPRSWVPVQGREKGRTTSLHRPPPQRRAARPLRPRLAQPAPAGRPSARARLLTDFKAERKCPSGPERRRAGTAARSGGNESSASGTDARGRGEGRASPRPAREDGGKGQGAGRALSGPHMLPTCRLLEVSAPRAELPGRALPRGYCAREPAPGVPRAPRPCGGARPAPQGHLPRAWPGMRPTERS